ncbi:MAG: hypothetical protein OWQ54_04410 [Sulfolobaceae archaeon]|nr:hypothetical protein [Sulfolobaceae archaeon]
MKLNEFMSIVNGVLCIKYDKLCKGEKKSVDAVCTTLCTTNGTEYDEKMYCFKVGNNKTTDEVLLVEIKEKLSESKLKEALDQIRDSKRKIDIKVKGAYVAFDDCSILKARKAMTAEEDEILLESQKELKMIIKYVCLDNEIDEKVRDFVVAARELS